MQNKDPDFKHFEVCSLVRQSTKINCTDITKSCISNDICYSNIVPLWFSYVCINIVT